MYNNKQGDNSVYETDDLEHAREIIKENPNAKVMYHDTSSIPTPFLHFEMGDRVFVKYNPDYIEYLRRENPDITEEEISEHMNNLSREEERKK